MKIYDHKNKRLLSCVTLFLTPGEAAELGDTARDLADHPKKHHHHINDASYQQEVIVAVYTPETLSKFDPESRAVIRDDVAKE